MNNAVSLTMTSLRRNVQANTETLNCVKPKLVSIVLCIFRSGRNIIWTLQKPLLVLALPGAMQWQQHSVNPRFTWTR